MRETRVRSLGWEDPLGGGHGNPLQYSCLQNAHRQGSLVGHSPWGRKESAMTERRTNTHTGLLWWLRGRVCLPKQKHGFDPWSGKLPCTRKQVNLWAITIDPVLLGSWATTAEPMCRNYWSREPSSPCITRKSSPHHSPQLQKSLHGNEDPAQPKICQSIHFLNIIMS